MSRASSTPPRPLSKWTPRHRALPVVLVLLLLAPALAPRPAAASWLDDLWAGVRLLWGETSWEIDPGGRPAPEPAGEVSAIWAAEGWQIDPSGRPAPGVEGGESAIWAEQGWEIDPGGLVMPPPTPTDAPDRP